MSNISMLALVAIAPSFMDDLKFSEFSILIAYCTIASLLLDLGLNTSTVVNYGRTKNDSFLDAAIASRLAIFSISALAWLIAIGLEHGDRIFLAVMCASATNIWLTQRACEHAQRRHTDAALSSLKIALARLAALAPMYLGYSPSTIVFFVYVVPVVAFLVPAARNNRHVVGLGWWRAHSNEIWQLGTYSIRMYVAGLAYGVIPYFTQLHVSANLTANDVGSFSLLMTFAAPFALLSQAAQAYLLPRVAQSEDAIGKLMRNFRTALNIGVCVGVIVLAVLGLGGLLQTLYGTRFMDIGVAYVVFASGYALAALIGLHNVRAHALLIPNSFAVANWSRLFAVAVLLATWGTTLLATCAITSAVMLGGELVFAAYLTSRASGNASKSLGG